MGRCVKKKVTKTPQTAKEKLKLIKKEKKQKFKQKRARLIIRNLPFEANEQNLKEHFEKFGETEEVKILKREDGKLVGCAFVQFKLVQKAAKARFHLNCKPFLGRVISVDFALAKDKFKSNRKGDDNTVIKQENELTIKEEPVDNDEVQNISVEDTQEADETIDTQKLESANYNDDGKEEENSDCDEESDGSSRGDDVTSEIIEPPVKKSKFESNDVSEGRTIFVKNVPFSATNEDLKECMKQFGPIFYALICVDKYTEHSKGTGFVKFCNSEDAETALTAGTELKLLGNILDCHKAIGRNEVKQKLDVIKEEKRKKSDSRNLHLVKEGVILAGSKAARGVSATDMSKRLQIEQYKTQVLRNLNMFVSRERLVVHNLPANWDDSKLKALIQMNSPKKSVIKEARIMRDLKNVDASGIGRSKEFGFVAFARHEDALATLQALNNNPDVFSSNRRPIVTFSIENKVMVKARQKRLEKSKLKNPKCKNYDPNVVKADKEKELKYENMVNEEQKAYVGVTAKPGIQKMRSRYNLKTQAKLHHDNLKKEKRKNKLAKKPLKERSEGFTKQPKQKVNKKQASDQFSKLVADYKKKLFTFSDNVNKKWYCE